MRLRLASAPHPPAFTPPPASQVRLPPPLRKGKGAFHTKGMLCFAQSPLRGPLTPMNGGTGKRAVSILSGSPLLGRGGFSGTFYTVSTSMGLLLAMGFGVLAVAARKRKAAHKAE